MFLKISEQLIKDSSLTQLKELNHKTINFSSLFVFLLQLLSLSLSQAGFFSSNPLHLLLFFDGQQRGLYKLKGLIVIGELISGRIAPLN
jgi:hypothetical protein